MPVTQSICFINKISVIEAFYYTVIQLNVIYEKFAHVLFHLYYNYYKPHKSLEILFASASLHFLSIQEEEIWHQPERVGDPHVPEADQLPIMGGDDYYLHGGLKGWWRVYVMYCMITLITTTLTCTWLLGIDIGLLTARSIQYTYYQILLNLVKYILGQKIKVDLQFYRIHKFWEIVYL